MGKYLEFMDDEKLVSAISRLYTVYEFEETHMISDNIDYLLDHYVMHDGKIFGDVIRLTEYC